MPESAVSAVWDSVLPCIAATAAMRMTGLVVASFATPEQLASAVTEALKRKPSPDAAQRLPGRG
jgi:hypothetical protein